jgi:vacuolar-type H+-ATPase subunit H
VLAEDRSLAGRIDILSLVDQLQEVVETSPRLPLSDRAVISTDLLLDLIDAIRNTIPHDVIEAERVLKDRRRLLEETQQQSEQLLEDAREQSRFMIQEHHIIKAAEIRAERIINQTEREASEIMESADEYVRKLFGHLEDEAMRIANEIRKAANQPS